jgi:hypothetical protein
VSCPDMCSKWKLLSQSFGQKISYPDTHPKMELPDQAVKTH